MGADRRAKLDELAAGAKGSWWKDVGDQRSSERKRAGDDDAGDVLCIGPARGNGADRDEIHDGCRHTGEERKPERNRPGRTHLAFRRCAWCAKCGEHFGSDGWNEPTNMPHVSPMKAGPRSLMTGLRHRRHRPVVLEHLRVERDRTRHEQGLNSEIEPIGPARFLAELLLACAARIQVRGGDGNRRRRGSVQGSRSLMHAVCCAPWPSGISFSQKPRKRLA